MQECNRNANTQENYKGLSSTQQNSNFHRSLGNRTEQFGCHLKKVRDEEHIIVSQDGFMETCSVKQNCHHLTRS